MSFKYVPNKKILLTESTVVIMNFHLFIPDVITVIVLPQCRRLQVKLSLDEVWTSPLKHTLRQHYTLLLESFTSTINPPWTLWDSENFFHRYSGSL